MELDFGIYLPPLPPGSRWLGVTGVKFSAMKEPYYCNCDNWRPLSEAEMMLEVKECLRLQYIEIQCTYIDYTDAVNHLPFKPIADFKG